MDNRQVRRFFIDKEDSPTPFCDALIAGGYRQKRGGYIDYTKESGVENPSQYWHLIESWSDRSASYKVFGRSIVCGELIFWMAEVSQAVSPQVLERLKDDVLQDPQNRTRGNMLIRDTCFDAIARVVEAFDA